MTLAWTEDLSVGIDVIDTQHRRLVDYINALDTVAASGSRDHVGRVLDDLIDYTMSHFAFEEQLQLDVGYRFTNAHKSVHDVFVKRVERYKERFDRGEDIVVDLQRMLKSWLIHHIKGEDRSYAREMQAKVKRLVEDRQPSGWLERSLGRFFGKRR